jgi:4-aminobutyrate aminotransferase
MPYPYWRQMPVGVDRSTSEQVMTKQALDQLDLLLVQQTAPKDTAAIIIEPVLGEGGYVSAPAAFLQGLRRVCDKHGILLIIDEVQSGCGRTGTYFAIEQSGVRPDIMLMAKGLGNGFLISAIMSRKELTDQLKPGSVVSLCLPARRMLLTRLSGRNLCRQRSVMCCRRRRRR